MITPAQLVQICPGIPQSRISGLIQAMDFYKINTPLRQAAFLAQCAHESREFTLTEENLNYSADRLLKVFPKYFKSLEQATLYARNPRAIASYVYANRMGNGPESSGDGYRYRGRGYIQLTGHDNYMQFAAATATDALNQPSLVSDTDGAALSAGWFWSKNSLNQLADKEDMMTITRRINGGLNGLQERMAYYHAARQALGI